MSMIFNGTNIIIVLDPTKDETDQRTVINKADTNIEYFSKVSRCRRVA